VVRSRRRQRVAGDHVAVLGIILATATNTLAKSLMFAFFVGFKESLKLIGLMFIAVVIGLGTVVLTTL
jgi:hypothetical protein